MLSNTHSHNHFSTYLSTPTKRKGKWIFNFKAALYVAKLNGDEKLWSLKSTSNSGNSLLGFFFITNCISIRATNIQNKCCLMIFQWKGIIFNSLFFIPFFFFLRFFVLLLVYHVCFYKLLDGTNIVNNDGKNIKSAIFFHVQRLIYIVINKRII